MANISATPTLKRLHENLEKLLVDKEDLQARLSDELGAAVESSCPDYRCKVFEPSLDARPEPYCSRQFKGR